MRWILKIILFPISLVLSILTAFLTFILGIGTTKFSVMKDKETGKYSVFFQAKDMKVMNKAFKWI